MNGGLLLLSIAFGSAVAVFAMLYALLLIEPRPDAEYIDVEAES